MRFAYLILAHDGPAQVAALVERLCPAGSPDIAVLHIDAKSPLAREAGALAAANPAIRLVERPVAVRWGHASMVEAMRRLLRTALAEGFTHAHLLSGSDWPVAPRAQITAEIGDRCWIEAVPGVQAERMERCRLDSRWLRPDPTRLFDWYRARLLREISARLPHRTSQPASHGGRGTREVNGGRCRMMYARPCCATSTRGVPRGMFVSPFAPTSTPSRISPRIFSPTASPTTAISCAGPRAPQARLG